MRMLLAGFAQLGRNTYFSFALLFSRQNNEQYKPKSMKKVIASLLLVVFAGLALSSCTDENVAPAEGPKTESNPNSWK